MQWQTNSGLAPRGIRHLKYFCSIVAIPSFFLQTICQIFFALLQNQQPSSKLQVRSIKVHSKYPFINFFKVFILQHCCHPNVFCANNLPNIFCAFTKSTTFLKIASLGNYSKQYPFIHFLEYFLQHCCHVKLFFTDNLPKTWAIIVNSFILTWNGSVQLQKECLLLVKILVFY